MEKTLFVQMVAMSDKLKAQQELYYDFFIVPTKL